MSQWNALHKKAKLLESRLETKIQKYSSLAQKINADFLCDEENPLIESNDEQELSSDIERDLNELSECITNMRNTAAASTTTPANHQEVLIKRYHEIHFDYSAEFRNTSVNILSKIFVSPRSYFKMLNFKTAVNRKRESMELFKSSKKIGSEEQDSSVAKLLKERSSIAASMKSINDVIR